MSNAAALTALAVDHAAGAAVIEDRRWLAARLSDTRREVLATRRWAWRVAEEKETLRQEVARLEAELAEVRALQERQAVLPPVREVRVALGWPDAFPVIPAAPRADEPVAAGPAADAATAGTTAAEMPTPPPVAAAEEPKAEWPRSTGAWGRRRGALALTVLPGAPGKERKQRHARRG